MIVQQNTLGNTCLELVYFPHIYISNYLQQRGEYVYIQPNRKSFGVRTTRRTRTIFLNSWAIHIETYTWQYNKAIQYVDCSNVVPFWTEQDTSISKKNKLKQGDTFTVQPIALESWTIYLNPKYYVQKEKK